MGELMNTYVTKPCRILILLIAALLLIGLTLPVQAEITRATVRNFGQDDFAIQTTKYARIDTGTIISKEMVRASIQNDNIPTWALIRIRIDMITGDWAGGFFTFYFTDLLEGNEKFIFDNSEVNDYIGKVEIQDYDLPSSLSVRSLDDFLALKLPEGNYAIALTASQVSNEVGDDEEEKATDTLNFKVVTIEDLNITKYPASTTSMLLEWSLPAIPMYDDIDCVSYSEITITGLDTPRELIFTHDQPPTSTDGTGLKGFPAGDIISGSGNAAIDLADYSIPFRMGGNYSAVVRFEDWNNDMIDERTRTFSFAEAVPELSRPSGSISTSAPTFTWSYQLYQTWVEYYDLVIQGPGSQKKTIEKIRSTSYTLTEDEKLAMGTDYTWYVIPYYKTDKAPFFTSAPENPRAFTTPAHNELDVAIAEPVNGAQLFAGEDYTFKADITLYDGAELSAANWTIGTRTEQGQTVTYTPAAGDAGKTLTVQAIARDSYDYEKMSETRSISIRNPTIAIEPAANTLLNRGSALAFSLNQGETRDIDEVQWFVDGEQMRTGETFSFTGEAIGNHTVQAKGISRGIGPDGGQISKEVLSNSVSITVKDPRKPEAELEFPAGSVRFLKGLEYPLTLSYTAYNEVSRFIWTIAGKSYETADSTYIWSPTSPGSYHISVKAVDEYDQVSDPSAAVLVTVIDPAITITSPRGGDSYPLGSLLDIDWDADDSLDSLTWTYKGSPVGNITNFMPEEAGEGTLQASGSASYISPDGSESDYEVTDSVTFSMVASTPPEIDVRFPAGSITVRTGETYTLKAEVTAVSTIEESWWIVDGKRYNGEDAEAAFDEPGTYTCQFFTRDTYLQSASQSFTLTAIAPALNITLPSDDVEINDAQSITLSAASADIANFGWYVNDSFRTSGTAGTATDIGTLAAGIYRIQARGTAAYTAPSGSRITENVVSSERTITVYSSQKPEITQVRPADGWKVFAGDEYEFTFSAASPNGELSYAVEIDGTVYPGRNKTAEIPESSTVTGSYTATDSFDQSSTYPFTLTVVNPELTIVRPAAGASFPVNEAIELAVDLSDIEEAAVEWFLDGSKINNPANFYVSESGSHTITVQASVSARASDGSLTSRIVSESVAVQILDRDPPEVQLNFPKTGYILFADTAYTFSGTWTDVGIPAAAQWRIGGQLLTGSSVPFTPSRRYTADDPLTAVFTVTYSDGSGLSTSKTVTAAVKAPRLKLVKPAQNILDASRPYTLMLDPAQTKDIDEIEWYVDDELMRTDDIRSQAASTVSFSYTSSKLGEHTVKAIGYAEGYAASGSPVRREAAVETASFRYIDAQPPQASISFPYAGSRLKRSLLYTLEADASSLNGIDRIEWNADGELLTGSSVDYRFTTAGEKTITMAAYDLYGKKSDVQTLNVLVIDPQLTLTNPEDGARFSEGMQFEASYTITDSGTGSPRADVYVDDEKLASRFYTCSDPGSHTLKGVYTYSYIDPQSGSVISAEAVNEINFEVLETIEPPQVSISLPRDGAVLRAGDPVTGTAVVVLDDSASLQEQNVLWNINGTEKTGSNMTFTPAERTDTLRISVTVTDSNGLSDSAEVFVKVIDPAVSVSFAGDVNGNEILWEKGEQITAVVEYRDIQADTLKLSVNGTVRDTASIAASGGSGTIRFTETEVSLRHTLSVSAEAAYSDSEGNPAAAAINSNLLDFSVRSESPASTQWSHEAGANLIYNINDRLQFSAAVTASENPVDRVEWRVRRSNGIPAAGMDRTHTTSGAGETTLQSQYSQSFAAAGSYTVTATFTDVFGQELASRTWYVTVNSPRLTFSLADNSVFAFNARLNLADYLESEHLSRIEYFYDTLPMESSSFNLNAAGSHTITVRGFPIPTEYGPGEPVVKEAVILVSDAPKPVITVLGNLSSQIFMVGETYTLAAEVNQVTAEDDITWVIGDREFTGSTVTLTIDARREGTLPVQVKARNEFGIEGTTDLAVKVIEPQIAVNPLPDNSWLILNATQNFTLKNRQDIETVTWYVDGERAAVGNDYQYLSSPVGSHTVYAEGRYRYTNSSGATVWGTAAADEVQFSVIHGTEPTVGMTFPYDGARLLADGVYEFSASSSSPNGSVRTVWTINGTTYEGEQIQWPADRTGTYTARVQAEDSYGLKRTTSTAAFTVINPSVLITSFRQNGNYNMNNAVSFTADTVDIDESRLQWLVNDEPVNPDAFSFREPGSYAISAVGSVLCESAADPSRERTEVSDTVTIKVFDDTPPIISETYDFAAYPLIVGEPVSLQVETFSNNTIERIIWTVDGQTSSGDTVIITPPAKGSNYTLPVQVEVTDSRNGTARLQWELPVIAPVLNIESPTNNDFKTLGRQLTLEAAGSSINSYNWYIDGDYYGEGAVLTVSDLSAGNHQITLRGKVRGMGLDGNAIEKEIPGGSVTIGIYHPDAPQIFGAVPNAKNVYLLAGKEYRFSFESAGSNGIAEESVTVNGSRNAGSSYTFIPTERGTVTVKYEARDGFYSAFINSEDAAIRNLAGSRKSEQTITCYVYDPDLTITGPKDGAVVPLGEEITLKAETTDIHGGLVWEIDGQKQLSSQFVPDETGQITIKAIGSRLESFPDRTSGYKDIQHVYEDTIVLSVFDSSPPVAAFAGTDDSQAIVNEEFELYADIQAESEVVSVSWTVDGIKVSSSPDSLRHTFRTAGIHTVEVEAVTEYGVAASESLRITAVAPSITIANLMESYWDTSQPEIRSITTGDAAAYSGHTWYINSVQSGTGKTYTGSLGNDWGIRSINVRADYNYIDPNGRQRTYPVTSPAGQYLLKIAGSPSITKMDLDESIPLLVGSQYRFAIDASSPNPIDSVLWKVNGADAGSGSSFLFEPGSYGSYTIEARAVDRYGQVNAVQYKFNVWDPAISLEGIEEGFVYPTGTELALRYFANAKFDEVVWTVGNTEQTSSAIVLDQVAENLDIGVEAEISAYNSQWQIVRMTEFDYVTGRVIDEKPPVILSNFPQEGTELLLGQEYLFSASAQSVNGIKSLWWVIDSKAYYGDEFTYLPSIVSGSRPVKVTVHAEDNYGARSSQVISVTETAPSIRLSQPVDGSVLESGIPFAVTAVVEGIDPDAITCYADEEPLEPDADGKYVLKRSGTYRIHAIGTREWVDSNGSFRTSEYRSNSVNVTVRSNKPPQIAVIDSEGVFADNEEAVRVENGTVLIYTMYTVFNNTLKTAFTIDGKSVEPLSWIESSDSGETRINASYRVSLEDSGKHTVRISCTDEFGYRDEKMLEVDVVTPRISYYLAGTSEYVPQNMPLTPVVNTFNIDEYWFEADGSKIDPVEFNADGFYELDIVGQTRINYPEVKILETRYSQDIQVVDISPPAIALAGPPEGARLFADIVYEIEADIQSFSEIDEVSWYLNDVRVEQGPDTLSLRLDQYGFLKGSKKIVLRAEALNEYGVSASASRELEQVMPALALRKPFAESLYEKDAIIELSASATDIDDIEWIVDDQPAAVAAEASVRFTDFGQHSVQVTGKTVGLDENFATVIRNIAPPPVTVFVKDPLPPRTAILYPKSQVLLTGVPVRIDISIESGNEIVSTSWSYNGETDAAEGKREEFTIMPQYTGSQSSGLQQQTVTCTIVDSFALKRVLSIPVRVLQPNLTVSGIEDGLAVLNTQMVELDVEAVSADRESIYIDGKEIATRFFILDETGNPRITVEAGWNYRDADGNMQEFVLDEVFDLSVLDGTPPDIDWTFPRNNDVLAVNESYLFHAEADSEAGIDEAWWTISGKRYDSDSQGDAVFTPYKTLRGTGIKVVYSAKSTTGIVSSSTRYIDILDGDIRVTSSSSAVQYPAGIPVVFTAERFDADIAWFTDGEEQNTTSLTYAPTFSEAGVHTVQAVGRLRTADGKGGAMIMETPSREFAFTVYSSSQVQHQSLFPESSGYTYQKVISGSQLQFRADAYSDNGDIQQRWELFEDGVLIESAASSSGQDVSFTLPADGINRNYRISVRSYDMFPAAETRMKRQDWFFYTIDPSLEITYPKEKGSYAAGSYTADSGRKVETARNDVTVTDYIVDGISVGTAAPEIRSLEPGLHSIEVVGKYSSLDRNGTVSTKTVSDIVQFRIRDLTPPDLIIQGVESYDKVLSGIDYTLSVKENNGLSLEQVEWFDNDGKLIGTGESIEYRFSYDTRKQSGNEVVLTCEAVSSEGIEAREFVTVFVRSPYLLLRDRPELQSGMPVTLLPDVYRDVETMEWKINGVPVQSSQNTVLLGDGQNDVTVSGKTRIRKPDGTLGYHLVEAASVWTAYPPVILKGLAVARSAWYMGQSMTASFLYEGDVRFLDTIQVFIDGKLHTAVSDIRKFIDLSRLSPGTHTVRAVLIDTQRQETVAEMSVKVYEPLNVEILQPTASSTIMEQKNFTALADISRESTSIGSGDIAATTWSLDGVIVSNEPASAVIFPGSESGKHTVSIRVEDLLGTVYRDSVEIEIQENLILNAVVPKECYAELPVSFEAEVQAANRELDAVLSEVLRSTEWLVDGKLVGTGPKISLQLQSGTHSVTAEYSGIYGTAKSRPVQIVSRPMQRAEIIEPLDGEEIIVTSQDQTLRLAAQGESLAEYRWVVNGYLAGRGSTISFLPEIFGFGSWKVSVTTFFKSVGCTDTIDITVKDSQVFADEVEKPATPEDFLAGAFEPAAAEVPLPQLAILQPTGQMDYNDGSLYLEARLEQVSGFDPQSGTYTWELTPADSDLETVVFVGRSGTAAIPAPGIYYVVCTYENPVLSDSVSDFRQIDAAISDTFLQLVLANSLYVPGEALAPQISGVDSYGTDIQDYSPNLVYYIDGQRVESLSELIAPEESGNHLLTAEYRESANAGLSASAEFRVNRTPQVTLRYPEEGAVLTSGESLLAFCMVNDDQEIADSEIVWMVDGIEAARGRNAVLMPSAVGPHTIEVAATDPYEAESRDTVQIETYQPCRVASFTVQDGSRYLYLDGDGQLSVSAAVNGGYAPEVLWRLLQGTTVMEQRGAEAAFGMKNLEEGTALIYLQVVDRGMEVFTGAVELQVVASPRLEILEPGLYQPFALGQPVTFNLVGHGLSGSDPRLTIDGRPVPIAWEKTPQASGTRYTAAAAPEYLIQPGMKNVVITAVEQGVEVEKSTFFEILDAETYLSISNPPVSYSYGYASDSAGTDSAAALIEVQVQGAEPAAVTWKSNRIGFLASGSTLDLSIADLPAGIHWISAELPQNEEDQERQPVADGFELLVLRPMEAVLLTGDTPLDPTVEAVVVFDDNEDEIVVQAYDQDGSAVSIQNISWLDDAMGVVHTGNTLTVRELLAEGIFPMSVVISSKYGGNLIRRIRLEYQYGNSGEELLSALSSGENLQDDDEDDDEDDNEDDNGDSGLESVTVPAEESEGLNLLVLFTEGSEFVFDQDPEGDDGDDDGGGTLLEALSSGEEVEEEAEEIRAVGTALRVSGRCYIARAGVRTTITVGTVLESADELILMRNSEMQFFNYESRGDVETVSQRGTYTWNSADSRWE